MDTFEITLQSAGPIDLADLGSNGFESLLDSAGIAPLCTWSQDADGRIKVVFRHEATDKDRAFGASERIASQLGTGVWNVDVAEVAPG